MANPTIYDLQNQEKYELIAELHHRQIKDFVLERLSEGGKMVYGFMIYQAAMILIGIFFFTRSIVLAFRVSPETFYYSFAALIFCFTILIPVHELLHGIALKLTGAKKINFGGYLKKFIFYAEADRHVLNKKQFAFIALTPLFAVKIITLTAAILCFSYPVFYFIIFVMSAHSLFCAGDIGLLSIFFKYGNSEIFTFDVKAEKTSYYFKEKIKIP